MTSHAPRLILLMVLAAGSSAAACGIAVDKDDHGRNANVDITTPMGRLSVKANSDALPDTGLPVHSGATPLRRDDHDNADVSIDGGFFGLKIAVARFEDEATPQTLVDYYKKELAAFGAVTECRGNLDMKKRGAVCRERANGEISLGVGTERDHHVVSVKPRGDRAEFTLVHVQTRD
jgi:hypothetical protein